MFFISPPCVAEQPRVFRPSPAQLGEFTPHQVHQASELILAEIAGKKAGSEGVGREGVEGRISVDEETENNRHR